MFWVNEEVNVSVSSSVLSVMHCFEVQVACNVIVWTLSSRDKE